MSEPIVRIVPHGAEGHFETRLCPECSASLDRLERFEQQVLQLCDLGLAEVAGIDHRGERCYRLTPDGVRWLDRERARRGGRS
ncbi:MAG: hypothetical protein M5U18_04245 [Dehalococcoidia bacterium]|nr:hypothetical protein [Dehalococcoidia bacterium]